MERSITLLAMVGVAALAFAVVANASGDLEGAKSEARLAAAFYTHEHLGITYQPNDWNAACNRRKARIWKCRVETDGGQCSGVLRLHETKQGFGAYGYRIGCAE
jgi:hypothetical protein